MYFYSIFYPAGKSGYEKNQGILTVNGVMTV